MPDLNDPDLTLTQPGPDHLALTPTPIVLDLLTLADPNPPDPSLTRPIRAGSGAGSGLGRVGQGWAGMQSGWVRGQAGSGMVVGRWQQVLEFQGPGARKA
ncbi:unnamed protein product [Calypogeia fissa]